jgi:hypothetical protein
MRQPPAMPRRKRRSRGTTQLPRKSPGVTLISSSISSSRANVLSRPDVIRRLVEAGRSPRPLNVRPGPSLVGGLSWLACQAI